ncbi:Galactose oxidase/kelch repeat superfamily protein [Tripterygium wilfordii]|uniref:Galactose oxidase/kelch repeat superfamily protein n=1 Tax=Tripterygium wilfordii TaxID=458696 RepID=A0A7J7CNT5_TRIWF|nr:F-box/kelch-repeat protein At2g44130-like [Tripterygium wilfordii]KAF5735711.1 Galactose oxidase/kelch repeat superfamily protein [Tripterygium wilfordii]
MESTVSTELIPGLPEELGLECLTRLPYTAHRFASRVCRRWSRLLLSKEFYYHRKKYGYTHKIACLVQARKAVSTDRVKPGGSPDYGITVFDSVSHSWERLDPVPDYPNGLPLFCQLASCEGKLVVMGGWDPDSYNPITDVWVYDFATQRWTRGKDMPSKRSFFAIGAFAGRVYVAGGHDENKNALKTGCVYDLGGNEWSELAQLSRERDECEGVVIGEEFWVLSGYGTESQGEFVGSADVYDFSSGQWRPVEGVWEAGGCPRTCVGVGKDGQLVNWAELDPAVRVGICGVTLGSRALVTGSGYQGGPHGFYMMEMRGGQNSKLEDINVSDEFLGFVQSGCSVEI